jgi:hypothetical protein
MNNKQERQLIALVGFGVFSLFIALAIVGGIFAIPILCYISLGFMGFCMIGAFIMMLVTGFKYGWDM